MNEIGEFRITEAIEFLPVVGGIPEEVARCQDQVRHRWRAVIATDEKLEAERRGLVHAEDPWTEADAHRRAVLAHWKAQADLCREIIEHGFRLSSCLREIRIDLAGARAIREREVRINHYQIHAEEAPNYVVANDREITTLDARIADVVRTEGL